MNGKGDLLGIVLAEKWYMHKLEYILENGIPVPYPDTAMCETYIECS